MKSGDEVVVNGETLKVKSIDSADMAARNKERAERELLEEELRVVKGRMTKQQLEKFQKLSHDEQLERFKFMKSRVRTNPIGQVAHHRHPTIKGISKIIERAKNGDPEASEIMLREMDKIKTHFVPIYKG